jgi:hypothetical protein
MWMSMSKMTAVAHPLDLVLDVKNKVCITPIVPRSAQFAALKLRMDQRSVEGEDIKEETDELTRWCLGPAELTRSYIVLPNEDHQPGHKV